MSMSCLEYGSWNERETSSLFLLKCHCYWRLLKVGENLFKVQIRKLDARYMRIRKTDIYCK